MKNQGERDELIVQIKLIELRDNQEDVNLFGKINDVGFLKPYTSLPKGSDLNKLLTLSFKELEVFAKQLGISKASTGYKADSIINGINFSIKSNRSAPPALVNHTARPGFEFAAKQSGGDISKLDVIVDEYWKLRFEKKIAEDVSNSHPFSPFKNKKDVLKPFINYFLFRGTGSGLSKLPAEKILGFTHPLDTRTWRIYDEINAIDLYWDKLVFSLRAKKGMPEGYPNNMSTKMNFIKPSIDRWTNFIDGKHRGALHIRSKA